MGTNGFSVWNSNWNWYISLFFVNAGLCVPNSNDYSYPLHKTFNDYPVFDVRVVSRKFGRKNEKCVVLFQWKKRTQQKRSGQLWFDEMELTKLHSSIFITQLAESEMLNKFEYFEYVDLSITLFISVNMANSSTLHIVCTYTTRQRRKLSILDQSFLTITISIDIFPLEERTSEERVASNHCIMKCIILGKSKLRGKEKRKLVWATNSPCLFDHIHKQLKMPTMVEKNKYQLICAVSLQFRNNRSG